MKDKKIVASFLGLALVSGALVAAPVHADATTKVKSITTSSSLISKKGKLVSKKTGEIVKGYASFKGKVYRNGVKFTGVLNTKYYKSGLKATAVYKGKYFKKGSLATGLYKSVYYSKGNVANGVFNKKYYSKGKLATGVYKNIYYAKGQKATGIYKKLYYVNGSAFTGEMGNFQYVKGVNKGIYEVDSIFILRKYFILGLESELPKTVIVGKSDGTTSEQLVTWAIDEKDQENLTLKDGLLTGIKEGTYVLTGTAANATNKKKLTIVIANADETYASIDKEIEELLKIYKKLEDLIAKETEAKLQTSNASELSAIDDLIRMELIRGYTSFEDKTNRISRQELAVIVIKATGADSSAALMRLAGQTAFNGFSNALVQLNSFLDINTRPTSAIDQLQNGLSNSDRYQSIINRIAPHLLTPAVVQASDETKNLSKNLINKLSRPVPAPPPPPIEEEPYQGGSES